MAGAVAAPRTAEQWKQRGNCATADGDCPAAIESYSAGLAALEAGGPSASVVAAHARGTARSSRVGLTGAPAAGQVPHELRAALLSNRSG